MCLQVTFFCIVKIDVTIDGTSSQELVVITKPDCEHLGLGASHKGYHSCFFVGRYIKYSTSHGSYCMFPGTMLDFSTSGSGFFDSFFLYVYMSNIIYSVDSI